MTPLLVAVADQAISTLHPPHVDDPAVRRRIDQLKGALDVTSSTSVLNFGNEVELSMARFTDTVLDEVMAKDLGPVHEKLTEIRLIAEDLSVDQLTGKGGFFGRLFSSLKREIAKFTDKFRTARQQIDTIAIQLDDQANAVNYGLAVLDRLFEQNLDRFRDLSLHVAAGHEVLGEWRQQHLPAAERAADFGSDADRMLAG